MKGEEKMEILFVTDFVCPYCIIAKEALRQALAEAGVQAKIRIQPYELTPEPGERVDTFHDEKRKERYQALMEPAKTLGLDVKFPPAVVPRPYTRLAFEGWHYAEEKGVGDAYADSVYRAYFIEQKDIGQMPVLTALAEQVGLEPQAFAEALTEGRYTQAQKAAAAYSREVLRVEYVPTIYVDDEQISFEPYQKDNWVKFFQESGKEKRNG